MSSSQTIPSVTDRIKPLTAGAPVVAIHFLGERAVFALGDDVAGLRADLTAIYAGRQSVTEDLWCHVTLARRP